MAIKDRLAARSAPRKPNESDGDDVAVRVANLERELAEERSKRAEYEKEVATWRTKAEQSEAKYTSEKIRSALAAAAAKANAIDPDDVVELVINRGARIDGDRVVFGAGAEAKPADDFVSSFVAGKPHLMRAAQIAQGSGSAATSAVQPPSAPPVKVALDPRDPDFQAKWKQAQLAEFEAKRKPKANGAT